MCLPALTPPGRQLCDKKILEGNFVTKEILEGNFVTKRFLKGNFLTIFLEEFSRKATL